MFVFYVLITCVIAITINFILKGKPSIIDDEKVLILGASSGIGKNVALQYAARNAKIILAARRTELLEKVKKECLALGKTEVVEIIKCDITNEDDLMAVVEKVKKEFGELNTVIVNAGVINVLSFEDLLNNDKTKGKDSDSSKVIDKIIKTNTYGPIYAAKYFIPLLKETKGRFVVVSSLAALIGAPTRALYAASKHALMGFFNSLRMELADSGVSISLVCPGSVSDTDLRSSAPDKVTSGNDATPTKVEEDKENSKKKEKKSLFSFLKITPEQCAKTIIEASDWRSKVVITPGIYKVAVYINAIAPSLIEVGAKLKYHFKN